jgi:hypothetical protein
MDFLVRVFDNDDMVYFFKIMMDCDTEASRNAVCEISAKVLRQAFHVTYNVKEHEGVKRDDPKVVQL